MRRFNDDDATNVAIQKTFGKFDRVEVEEGHVDVGEGSGHRGGLLETLH